MKRAPRHPASGLFLIAGDVHGHWGVLAEHAQAARSRHGRLDGIICVGDVQAFRNEDEVAGMHCPSKYRTIGDFPEVMSGAIQLGAPTWFIGGNHEPWPTLDVHGPGEWVPHATFLGRAGVGDVLGLRVAYLSAIHSDRVSRLRAKDRHSLKDRCYWVDEEVEQTRREGRKAGVDLLVTHEWSSGIGRDDREQGCGSDSLELLAREVRPTLYVMGHMHTRLSTTLGAVRVEALSHVLAGPAATLVAEWIEGELTVHPPLDIAVHDYRYAAVTSI